MFKNLLMLTLAAATIESQAMVAKATPKVKKKNRVEKLVASSAADSVFFFNPGEKDGMHIALRKADGEWVKLGRIFSSDYSRWGAEKRMFTPFVTALPTGGYAAVFTVNNIAPCFAVAYSDDLVNWRPQDYPRMSEQGCFAPVIRSDGNGRYTVLFKTKDGSVRQTVTTDGFRHFSQDAPASKADYDAIDGLRTHVSLAGKGYEGTRFAIDSVSEARVRTHFDFLAKADLQNKENLRDDATRFARLGDRVEATIRVDGSRQKTISDKLIGIFFEDISYAADGGLYAEMVQNRDFEYNEKDRKGWKATTAWTSSKGDIRISTEQPLSENNPHYAIVSTESLTNEGWDGFAVKKGELYDFSFYVKNLGGKKNFNITLRSGDEKIAEAKVKTKDKTGQWIQYTASLAPSADATKAMLVVSSTDKSEAGLDMISLFPRETFCHRKNGLRKDLAQTLADLKPKFVRFPGGCMSHGNGLENIYHWNHTVGPLQDRKPDFNCWNYHQTRGLGFYEYFQFCEDIGAEPLPVLAAGVPCQNSGSDKNGYGGQQGGIPMEDMPAYIQELCDMIEWANGDPATNKWAKMRADAGHPAPFNLKYIGIGNEDLISTVFEERCLMIAKAIKERYPSITICGTVGPFHYPSSDYIEGWKFTNEHKDVFDMVDEHYYESVGWFLNNQHYYDNYDRGSAKVYLGEWAAKVGKGGLDCALVEAMHLCNIERNGDIVEMTSYAPLLSKNGHSNWSPDMIYFGNTSIDKTPSYETQRLFSTRHGDRYINVSVAMADSVAANRVAASVVKDSRTGKTYLRVVNILPQTLDATLSLKSLNITSQSLVYEGFSGKPGDRSVNIEKGTYPMLQDSALKLSLPPYSLRVIEL